MPTARTASSPPLALERDAGGVVAAVLELLEPGEQDLLDRALPDVADDSAHAAERIASLRRRVLLRARLDARNQPRHGTASASSAVGASTITRTSGSVPLGRTSTRPRPLERRGLGLDVAARSPSTAPVERGAVGEADVDEPLRQLLHRVAVGEVAALERLERQQRGGDAVAGGHEAHVDDVAGLLAAERPAALAQRLEHVAVADRRGRDLDAGVAHRGVEAVVRHHRHRDAAARQPPGGAQVQRGERDQLVAVDDRAVAVDGEHAVAVAVEREAGVVAALAHVRGERVDVRRAAAGVDVAAVGRVGEHVDVGAEAAEDLRRGAVGRAVGAVERDPRGRSRSRPAKRSCSARR